MIPPEMPSITPGLRPISLPDSPGQRTRRAVPPAPVSSFIYAEDEDAQITGMTRSLQRRVMALNFPVRGKNIPSARKAA